MTNRPNLTIPDHVSERVRNYILQACARALVPTKRVSACMRRPAHNADGLAIKVRDARAFYVGLQTCGSVWDCAVCARKVSEKRARELNDAVNQWLVGQRQTVLLATYTLSHTRAIPCATVLTALKTAYRTMTAHRSYKSAAIAIGVTHSVVATEVTHSVRNGWHAHLHVLLFVKDRRDAAVRQFAARVSIVWRSELSRAGAFASAAHGFDIRGGNYAADYAAKWGVVRETANAVNKRAGRGGRTPQQLLESWLAGNDADGRYWTEYSAAFHGTRQLTWSRGAKSAFGLTDDDDAAIADAVTDGGVWANISWTTWQKVLKQDSLLRERLLTLAESNDYEQFTEIITRLNRD